MEIRPIFSSLRRHKVTALLVVLEIALTCAIVCNAVFLVGQRLTRMDMPSGVAEHELVQVRVGGGQRSTDHGRAQGQADMAALRQIAGVTSVSAVTQVPFGNSSWNSSVMLSPTQKQATLNATTYFGEGLIKTFGLNLLKGRDFTHGEYENLRDVLANEAPTPTTTIITSALAQRLWPGENALGKTLYMGDRAIRVIGIIDSLVRPSLNNGDDSAQWSMLMPLSTNVSNFVLRTAPDQRQRVIKDALAKLKASGPRRIVLEKRSFDSIRADFFQSDRAMTGLMLGVILALLLVTALGIVGLGSFWVAQRRRTIGVRRALGATRGNILRYFQTENFILASIGIVLGMALAYGINLYLMSHYELPRLPWFYLPIGAIVLWLIGQIAVLGPALRAARVPPVVATRSV
ncbi:MAG: ABC transporter permease [Xanthomonadales bacterium]|nr:ABC transporter permease [Xanthomonadales bacterium]